mmetsp:Transcript_4434/g.9943  ORF Transcript_4434/g.9943 Transcript_4434/m.9943 type:complete len:422 (+) Transcript_4434:304-1569(+)
MIFRGTICILALAASSSAFAPTTSTSTVAAGRSNDVIIMKIATDSTSNAADAAAVSSPPSSYVLHDFDHHTSTRLPYSPTGYSTWEWKTHHNQQNQPIEESNDNGSNSGDSPTHLTSHSINYLEVGDSSKPALLLVHGFGASSYHFRHNIPVLARKYHVYAIDMLGFGWSDKPIMDYDATVWKDQVVDFVQEVILNRNDDSKAKRSIAIAGNSLGGYTAMYASSDERIKENVKACILLNAAGRFRDPEAIKEPSEPNPIIKAISSAIQRFVIACSFVYTKQPLRIEQVLRQVYPIDDSNVDSELVESIQTPAQDDTAAEVFYRVITKNGAGPQSYVDDILKELDCPVLLAWGESDPWIRSAAADKIQSLHAEFHGENVAGENGPKWIKRASIDAGHCPHDEAPDAVNGAILSFLDEVLSIA